MENKIIKYVYFVVFLLLAVSCDSLSINNTNTIKLKDNWYYYERD